MGVRIRPTTYLHANLHLQKGPALYDYSLNCENVLRLNKDLGHKASRCNGRKVAPLFAYSIESDLIGRYTEKKDTFC